jgi:hypothetical protein
MENERVVHYLHASSEQKLLEVNKFILEWKSGIAFAIILWPYLCIETFEAIQ